MPQKGSLVVFEGTDGSGKNTQAILLKDYLERTQDRPVGYVSFPEYDRDSSKLVRDYLTGRFGTDPDAVSPFAASTFYAIDRYISFHESPWGRIYRSGGIIVADRYTTSNAVHQAEKIHGPELTRFLDWLFEYEYRQLCIPAPDKVIYLDMPPETTLHMMKARAEKDAAHVTDIHEKNPEYLARCRENGLRVAGDYGWTVIRCSRDGRPRPVSDIHDDVVSVISGTI